MIHALKNVGQNLNLVIKFLSFFVDLDSNIFAKCLKKNDLSSQFSMEKLTFWRIEFYLENILRHSHYAKAMQSDYISQMLQKMTNHEQVSCVCHERVFLISVFSCEMLKFSSIIFYYLQIK